MRRASSTDTHRYPLRPVVRRFGGLSYDYDVLACGHTVPARKDRPAARARRCRHCPKMEAADAAD